MRTFHPPRRSVWVLAVGCCALCAGTAAAQERIHERVDVSRVLVDVRVTTSHGEPVRGLTADDFEVELDGQPARVEWATWVGSSPEREQQDADVPSSVVPADISSQERGSGRLIVFFFQNGLTSSRIEGTLRMMRESARVLDGFGPHDRAAVVVYDSRLRVRQDFTADRHRLRDALGRGVLKDGPAGPAASGGSLMAVLDRTAARGAATPERALKVLAEALGRIQGAKSLVMFGFGFGEYRPVPGSLLGRAELDGEYEEAREALVTARVTVFALDVTQADAHTLEAGLMAVAEETGGFYSRTHEFPTAAIGRLVSALQGYYVLSVEALAGDARGRHRISVRTSRRGTRVLARKYYFD